MQDNDWMISGRLHSGQVEMPVQQAPNSKVRVDSQLLQQRKLRLEGVPAQPIVATNEELLSEIDRSMARNAPAFTERIWTVGDAARWVTKRTPEAVNGLSVDEEKLFEVLPEIHAAFLAGEVSTFATTKTTQFFVNCHPRRGRCTNWSLSKETNCFV